MTEKTSFSDLVHVTGLDPKMRACANCFHGFPFRTQNLQTLVMCRAMPPSAIGVPTRDKITGAIVMEVQAKFPNLLPDEWCGLFESRKSDEKPVDEHDKGGCRC